jgi:hypothetical protein
MRSEIQEIPLHFIYLLPKARPINNVDNSEPDLNVKCTGCEMLNANAMLLITDKTKKTNAMPAYTENGMTIRRNRNCRQSKSCTDETSEMNSS